MLRCCFSFHVKKDKNSPVSTTNSSSTYIYVGGTVALLNGGGNSGVYFKNNIDTPVVNANPIPITLQNSSSGYFAGGRFGIYSTIDRIDYSNDTATAAVKGPLSASRY